MKCKHCDMEYGAGSHFCQSCGRMTAEGEMGLAMSEFAAAMKHLAKEATRMGKVSLQNVEPELKTAIQRVSRAGSKMAVAAKPAGQKAIIATAKAMKLAAHAAEKVAKELNKAARSQ